jgi:mono/diheme cytochrome c family protein
LSFLRDVQPIFDKYCAACHTGLKPPRGLDFSGGLTARHNRAYDTIIGAGLVALSNKNDDAKITPPLAFGSHKSKLVASFKARREKGQTKLTADEWVSLVTWVDANAPYHDAFIDKRPEKEPYDLAADTGLARAICDVHARRCASCHKPEEVSRTWWIDLRKPERSLFLVAPLAKEAGGTAKCKEPVYKDDKDPDYLAVRQAVEAAVRQAWANPRRDLKALAPQIRLGAAE